MPIKQIHLKSCNSTQQEIKSKFKEVEDLSLNKNLLISCNSQTNGIGRQNRKWKHLSGSLAFSFSVLPTTPITLTVIEISILIKKYLELNYQLDQKIKIKWPNDLYFHGKKLSGLLIDLITFSSQQIALIGVGINFTKNDQFSYLDKILTDENLKLLPLTIYQFILKNRMNQKEILFDFEENCFHLNQTVQIDSSKGIFKGISSLGEAIIEQDGIRNKFLSGSLIIL